MSDFLGNLVKRSLSATDAVRPMVHSIFEPPVNGGAIFRGSATPELPIVKLEVENRTAERLGQLQSLWRGKVEQGVMAIEPLLPQGPAVTRTEPPRVRPVVDDNGAPSEKTQGRVAGDPIAVKQLSHAQPSPSTPAETLPSAVTRKLVGVAPLTADEVPGSKPRNANDRLDESAPVHLVGATRPEPPSVALGDPEHSMREIGAAPLASTHAKHIRTEQPESLPAAPVASLSAPVKPVGKRSDAPPAVIEKEITKTIVREPHMHDEPAPGNEARTGRLQPAFATPTAPIVPASIIALPRVLPSPNKQITTEAQSIHVTIGRVEVRAIVPPQVQARPQTAPVPRMSLDEYLRQRAAGGR
ncbi:MAG TPA: hypothetical protein VH229_13180 [Candidatus Udaeobacter sp.]|nr:hypothetical protein [Candidatus Udaeobacter sp.]